MELWELWRSDTLLCSVFRQQHQLQRKYCDAKKAAAAALARTVVHTASVQSKSEYALQLQEQSSLRATGVQTLPQQSAER
eukprot:11561-Heterococcus_DN1.PRE.4